MAAVINTVHLLLASIGINDVDLYDGRTNAERLSSDMFHDDFISCMDKTDDENESDIKAYFSRTVLKGGLRQWSNGLEICIVRTETPT